MVLEIKHPTPVNFFTGKVFLKCSVCLRYALRLEKRPYGPVLIFPLVIGGNGLHSTDDTHKIKLIWIFGLMRNSRTVFDFRTCCGEVGDEFFMLSQIKGTQISSLHMLVF